MRTQFTSLALAALFLSSAAQKTQAQQGSLLARRATPLSLAAIPAVGKELKFTDEQSTLAKQLRDDDRGRLRELIQNFRDLSADERKEKLEQYTLQRTEKEQQLTKSISKEKFKRLRQLSLQAGGLLYAFIDRKAMKELEITEEKRRESLQELRVLREEFRAAGSDPDAWAKLRVKVNELLEPTLSDEQKSKWKTMLGKPAGEELMARIREATTRSRD